MLDSVAAVLMTPGVLKSVVGAFAVVALVGLMVLDGIIKNK